MIIGRGSFGPFTVCLDLRIKYFNLIVQCKIVVCWLKSLYIYILACGCHTIMILVSRNTFLRLSNPMGTFANLYS